MKENWKDAFSFNHRERKGTAILLMIIAISLLVDAIYPIVFPPEKLSYSIVSYNLSTDTLQSDVKSHQRINKKKRITYPIFRFDPNSVSESQLQKLGFKAYQIQMLMNYRKAGGEFKDPSDFDKLYFVNDSIYKRFVNFLDFPLNFSELDSVPSEGTRENSATKHERVEEISLKTEKKDKPSFKVMMNQSDTSSWKRFRGIGSGYANRIVKYRDILGGYVNKEQLLEVYGFDTSLYQRIEHQLVIDKTFIKRINLNTVSTNRLSKHPYITWNMARRITDSRVQDGPFESTEDLLKRNLLNEVLYRKIVEYLEVY
jgi:DNA uptake protein ComE-like DNA-binding protein